MNGNVLKFLFYLFQAQLLPFRMKFRTNAADFAFLGLPFTNEQSVSPGGIVGFSLDFFQTSEGCD